MDTNRRYITRGNKRGGLSIYEDQGLAATASQSSPSTRRPSVLDKYTTNTGRTSTSYGSGTTPPTRSKYLQNLDTAATSSPNVGAVQGMSTRQPGEGTLPSIGATADSEASEIVDYRKAYDDLKSQVDDQKEVPETTTSDRATGMSPWMANTLAGVQGSLAGLGFFENKKMNRQQIRESKFRLEAAKDQLQARQKARKAWA